MFQAYVSVKRIQEFLLCTDLDDVEQMFVKSADYSIYVRDGAFSWEDEEQDPYLNGIDLKIRQGALIAVVGNCGSGKSSLISALLGDMRRRAGFVQLKGSVAYVPQQAWIQNMTLRDNILFGREYTHNKYWKVIESCCLKSDLAMMDRGDRTELGEKGSNLSGGQKQRVSVARAVYNNADIYFLDDPLSAVDAHVGKDLFKNVIGNSGLLKNKTRLLVTHAIHWLPMVDSIIVMDDGRISEHGTYDELMTHDGPFARFLLQHLRNEPQEDLDDPEIKWIRENMLELAESVTSEGGNSDVSESAASRLKQKKIKPKKKKTRQRHLSSLSYSQSVAMNQSTFVAMATQLGQGNLTSEETIQEGAVKLRVIVDFLKAFGLSWALLSVLILLFYQCLSVYSMFWLTFWTEDAFLKNSSNVIYDEYRGRSTSYMTSFLVMVVIQGAAIFVSYQIALRHFVTASNQLHCNMLLKILRSPMSFFDTVPIGRILNRFATDIDALDNRLPEAYRQWINMVLSTLAAMAVMILSTPLFALVIIPAIISILLLIRFYLPTARKLRRYEAVTRSPIYNHFSESVTGCSVIKAFKCSNRFINELFNRVDHNSAYILTMYCGNRWIATRLEFLGNLILMAVSLIAVTSDVLNGGQLGLSVSYAVQITFALNNVIYSVMEMETNGVSAERVHEYIDLPSEAEWLINQREPRLGWPETGNLEYRNYSTRYRPGLEPVLRGVSFNIKHGEKVGVVGRTGAGKSSLALSLFRIIEATGGSIQIDGEDISVFGLHTLRSNITILPQDPVLFSGTLRMNIDPRGQFSEEEIWRAVEASHLKSFVRRQAEGLDYDCGEAGSNFSVGQRQLVCLARTLLNKTKILILDEATAAVDMETDALIQQTIRTQFNDVTILTIAHRLNTIMDYDRIMVLDKGLVKEFGPPRELLKDREGIFYLMAKDARLI